MLRMDQAATPERKFRVLFMSEAVSLAHLGRPLALASSLDPNHYEIHMATGENYKEFLAGYPFIRHTITNLPHATFQERLHRGKPLYDAKLLALQAQEDIALLSDVKPDVVIGDFRLSLGVSARVTDVPYLTITNAHWNPLASLNYPVPDVFPSHFLPLPVVQAIFNIVLPHASARHIAPHNELRKTYGLPPLLKTIAALYTDADHVLYADLPELFLGDALLPHHVFIGPILWSPKTTASESVLNAKKPYAPLVYFSLGTSGSNHLVPVVFRALGKLPVTVIASMAGKSTPIDIPANIFSVPYLSGEDAVRYADIVVCNGGTGTAYQALSAGKPILGIASNLDQFSHMERVANAGAGILLRSDRLTAKDLSSAITKLLKVASFRTSAQRLRDSFSKHDFHETFPRLLGDILTKHTRQKPSPNPEIL